jgi:hypothetical protein
MISKVYQGTMWGAFGYISGVLFNDLLYIRKNSGFYWLIPTVTVTLGVVHGFTANDEVKTCPELIRNN